MGSKISEIKKSVLKFIWSIRDFKIKEVVIFGSRIKGDYLENSDLDLILISDDFEGLSFTDRITNIYRYYDNWTADFPLEILCYTQEEFNRKKKLPGIVRDASRNGLHLKVKEFIEE